MPVIANGNKWQPLMCCFFLANGTNIVANWVKKQHKIVENSRIVFKWQILAKESTI